MACPTQTSEIDSCPCSARSPPTDADFLNDLPCSSESRSLVPDTLPQSERTCESEARTAKRLLSPTLRAEATSVVALPPSLK
mmetsp:Transcript_52888/g.115404  ORF Transcript_52888/g.115404 Transcript_52888/m.115404 type:complete len:82 (+) Transcript_52888:1373-1618(+)